MNRYLILKAVFALLAMGLMLFGINETQTDPTLRDLKTLHIADLERGATAPQDQYIEINDAYLLPFYLIETHHSRKRGDSAYVFVPLGSQEMQAQAYANKTVKPSVWIKLSQNYHTDSAARAAMQADAIYARPRPVRGVVSTLESSVQEEMLKGGKLTIEQPMALHEGSSPLSWATAVGLATAGGLLALVLAMWLVADFFADRWRAALAQPGVQVFAGDSRWFLMAVLGVPMFVGLGALAVSLRIETGGVPWALVVLSLLGLALAGWAFACNRAAVVLSAESLDIVRRKHRTGVPLSEVHALSIDEKKMRGVTIAHYTLHGLGQPVKVGSSLFKGGVDKAQALGLALRQILVQRLAPQAMERIGRGERVSFGPFSMSSQGLFKGQKLDGGEALTWAELASVELKNGKIKVKQKGKMFAWDSYAVKKVLNLDVLLHALEVHGVSVT